MTFRASSCLAVSLLMLLAPDVALAGDPRPALLEAALGIDTGVPSHVISNQLQRFERLCEVARTQVSLADPPRKRAALLLAVLHQELLTGPFRADQWSVGETLDSGRYNCLTATILYIELCRRFDLRVSAVSTPGHLACRLEGPTPVFIEATSARWFDLRPSAYNPDAPASGASAMYVSGRQTLLKSPHATRVLSDSQVVAKVHYNRALALLGEDRFEVAVEHLRASRQFDPLDGAARENELAALHNWALALAEAGRLDEAARRIAEGLALAPESPLLKAGQEHLRAVRLTGPRS